VIDQLCGGGYPDAFGGAVKVAVESRPAKAGLKFTKPTLKAGEFD
jgi:hypothetical protein